MMENNESKIEFNVLIPPLETKKIIDLLVQKLLAMYIQDFQQNQEQNSSAEQFLTMIEQHMKTNKKYDFLRNNEDPYRPYFLREKFKVQQQAKKQTDQSNEEEPIIVNEESDNNQQANEGQKEIRNIIFGNEPDQNQLEIEKEKEQPNSQEIVEAPQENQFQIQEPQISLIEKRILQITAQYVAINGQGFLQRLTKKVRDFNQKIEFGILQQNRQYFEFLRPTHPLFNYFTTLVEHYSLISEPPAPPLNESNNQDQDKNYVKQQLTNRQKYVYKFSDKNINKAKFNILEEGMKRYKWDKFRVEQQKYQEKLKEAGIKGDFLDRLAIEGDENEKKFTDDGIDWHEFVVVQTIDLDEFMGPKKTGFQDLNAQNNKMINISNQIQSAQEYEQDKNKQNFENFGMQSKKESVEILKDAPLENEMKIIHNYVKPSLDEIEQQKKNASLKEKSQACPKCSRQIKVIEWKQHTKICLLDKKQFQEQQEHRLKREAQISLADGDEISKNLKRFAHQRPDLFQENFQNDGNLNEKQKDDDQQQDKIISQAPYKTNLIWDGQSNQLTRTHANVAMMQNQQRNNLLEAEKAKQEKELQYQSKRQKKE